MMHELEAQLIADSVIKNLQAAHSLRISPVELERGSVSQTQLGNRQSVTLTHLNLIRRGMPF